MGVFLKTPIFFYFYTLVISTPVAEAFGFATGQASVKFRFLLSQPR